MMVPVMMLTSLKVVDLSEFNQSIDPLLLICDITIPHDNDDVDNFRKQRTEFSSAAVVAIRFLTSEQ